MLSKRIIPCLDIKEGRTVKGINFVGLRDAGDPVELASAYSQQGADELVLLDISATGEDKKTSISMVRQIAREINIPFTIGGGISRVEDVAALLEAGADKTSINSAAVTNPDLITVLSREFGSQCVVVAIDAKRIEDQWIVYTHGGNRSTKRELFSWAKECQERGAGEILFTSIDHDGAMNGFATDVLFRLHQLLKVPVIASGGAGDESHFKDAFLVGAADAALAAGVFHFNKIKIPALKKYLNNNQIPIRICN